jgi:hypothetical protein
MNSMFANCSKEDIISPLTVKKIAEAQEVGPNIQNLASDTKYTR